MSTPAQHPSIQSHQPIQSLQVWAWSGALLMLALSYAKLGSFARAGIHGLRPSFGLAMAATLLAILLLAILSRPKVAFWLARPLCFLTGCCFTLISLALVRWSGSLL